jgi:integrase
MMPELLRALRARNGMAARALEFTISTAARTAEVLGARWGEIDLDDKIWTVPAERMKADREHRVPLSDAAISALSNVLPLALMRDGKPEPGRAGFSLVRAGLCRCRR